MDIDDGSYPMVTTSEELSCLLHAIRNPSIMRQVVWQPLGELLYVLIHAEVEKTPEVEIYVENRVIGLLTALRPMLTATVNAFFELPVDERTRRERLFVENEAEEVAWRVENDEDYELGHREDATSRALETLRAAVSRLTVAEQKGLAIDLVTKPEAMICNAVAVEAFQRVLELTHVVEPWTQDEIAACHIAQWKAAGCLLRILRDLRRTLN